MGDAVQLVMLTDLASSRKFVPIVANDTSGTFAARSNAVLRTTITQRSGQLHADATITENSTQKTREFLSADVPASSGVLALLNQLATRLDSQALPFSTRNNRALQQYVIAAESPKLQDRVDALTSAIRIDASFGLAYISLADTEAQASPQNVAALLQAARRHEAEFTPFDRARMNAVLARYSHATLQQQQAAYRAVVQIAPNDSDALVQLGSLSFLMGDADAGTRELQRALELNPGNAAVQRTLAEGLLQAKRFQAAERILVGMDSNVAVLPELAVCVLLEGDVARANAIAERLFASVQNNDFKTLFRAVWSKLSGQPQKAVDLLTTTHFEQPAAQSIAFAELSVWQMMAGDFAGARRLAAQAQQLDPRPGSYGSLAALLSTGDAAADAFEQKVATSSFAANPRAKGYALGYGLFLGHHYAEAQRIWAAILQESGATDLRARVMFAACLIQQGKPDQARQVNAQPFVPDFGDLYATVSFLEMNRDLGIGVL
jgi:tetratricopeptide (TPR) repeat protein